MLTNAKFHRFSKKHGRPVTASADELINNRPHLLHKLQYLWSYVWLFAPNKWVDQYKSSFFEKLARIIIRLFFILM